ncbi:MAG: LysR substrate-binding domain-containing protein [Burkholderiaceae bacterium]
MAADRLHVTQPAVSRQIHDVEDELGVRLFDRTTRGLRLTEPGSAFLNDCRRILAMVEQAKRSARLTGQGLRGQLRIGMVESAGWDGLFPRAIGEFQREAPGVSLQIEPLATPRQLEALEARELDAGVMYALQPLSDAYDMVSLARHDVILAVPADAPPPKTATIRAADLNGQPFVLFQRSVYPVYYDRLLAACQRAGLTPNVVQEVGSEGAELTLVSAGIGIAIVNSANCGRPPARVRFVQLADVSVPLSLSFVRSRANTNPALERLTDVLRRLSLSAS